MSLALLGLTGGYRGADRQLRPPLRSPVESPERNGMTDPS
jgi:hypothetical protein